ADALDTALPASGYRREAKTFFVCEGVTHYLSAGAVDALFRYVARNAAPGSRLVFTYIHRAALGGSGVFEGADRTLAAVRRGGGRGGGHTRLASTPPSLPST